MKNMKIPLAEYRELVAKAERIAAVERLIESVNYPTLSDVKIILGIKKENENETV